MYCRHVTLTILETRLIATGTATLPEHQKYWTSSSSPNIMSTQAAAIRIVEVGPRDGLQNLDAFVPTSTKIQLINRLRKAGLQTIELTSAVSPKAIPQLADYKKLLSDPSVKALQQRQGLRLPVLVPNAKGLQVAIEHGVTEVAVFVSATEGFSKANINCTVEEGLQRARTVTELSRRAGMAVRGYEPYSRPPYEKHADLLLGTSPAYLRIRMRGRPNPPQCCTVHGSCWQWAVMSSVLVTLSASLASEVKRLITFLVEKGTSCRCLGRSFSRHLWPGHQ